MIALLALGIAISLAVAAAVRRTVRFHPPVSYAMVPAKDFDPPIEEVRRFGAGLVEARTAVGVGTNAQQMVRLAIVSDPEGNVVTLISSSPRSRSVLERVGYPGCELQTPDDLFDDRLPNWITPVPPDLAPPGSTASTAAEPSDVNDTADRPSSTEAGQLIGDEPRSEAARQLKDLLT